MFIPLELFTVIGIIVAAIVAIIVAFIPSIMRRYNRPKFSIEFENEEPFCRVTDLVGGGKAYWIRLRVRNVGRSIARRCEGKIVRITDAETKEDRKDFDPMVLRWVSTQAYEPIDINKSESEYLDLVYRTTKDDRTIFIAANPKLRLGINLGPPLKDYIFHVTISGENVEPLQKSYYYKKHFYYDRGELSEYRV